MVGRDPHDCDAARSGLRPIRIDVRANGMSRAHLEIRRVDGRVFIIDRQSTNGVAIRPAGQTQWIRIAPWKPIVWLPGMSVRIGSRILRLEAAGQRPTVRNEPIIPIAVRTAKPANNQHAAVPPSSASTVRINHAGRCGHAMATPPAMRSAIAQPPKTFQGASRSWVTAAQETGPVAATSERNAA